MRGDPERGQAIFTIWGTGIGIAEDDLGRLFQPFRQLDSRLSCEYAGTGLGLALVRRIAETHGGSVGVESTLGEGSRFSVLLPWQPEATPKAPTDIHASQVAKPAPTLAPIREAASATPAGALPSILLVEDNRGNVLLT